MVKGLPVRKKKRQLKKLIKETDKLKEMASLTSVEAQEQQRKLEGKQTNLLEGKQFSHVSCIPACLVERGTDYPLGLPF